MPAFKGAFLIIFGIVAMLRIYGSIASVAVMFIALIGMISILLLSSGLLFRKSGFKGWIILSGLINLFFCIFLALHLESSRPYILRIIGLWVVFYAITEIVEAGILIYMKNAFAALFLLNAMLTLLFGYFIYVLIGNFTSQGVFYLGLIALVFGVANELSAYLLSIVRDTGKGPAAI